MTDQPLSPSAVSSRAAAARLLQQAERVLAAGEAPSPCVSVCRMSEQTRLCTGCWRTLDEIAAWSTLSQADKHVVWGLLAQRLRAQMAVT